MAKDEHFGRWLRRTIEDREQSQAAFSREVGIARQTLMVWLSAERPHIHGHNVARLARALGVPREVVEEKLGTAQPAAA